MTEENTSFTVGIDFQSVLRAISKQIYETPLAFIRENVQNAVDAIRIQALRENVNPGDERYEVIITTSDKKVTVRDNGIGMTTKELQNYFWTIGASGKKTQEAVKAGCVGMFGIGGFANFGVCNNLEVISQTEGAAHGTLTKLSQSDIETAGASIPSVTVQPSDSASPRGTIVVGYIRETINQNDLQIYLKDFVRYVPTKVLFNGTRISQISFSNIEDKENLTEVNNLGGSWNEADMVITGRFYEDRGHTIVAMIDGLKINNEEIELVGQLRFENGTIDVFKRGFKLCATQIGTAIGVSGRLDCDRFIPTAGRDSLEATTISLLGRIFSLLEKKVIDLVLQSSERIAQHTRVFRYIINHGLVEKLGNLKVRLADGSDSSLADIRRKAEQGNVGIYFGVAQKQALNQIMQARGHVVILLSSDSNRQSAERSYLEQFCKAKPFDGVIDCVDYYSNLTRYEKIFLSELEMNISKGYEVRNFKMIAGKLTEDIPVYVKEHGSSQPIDIFIDVKHQEISKLEELGYSQLLYSLIATFCREYLGPSLKKWSPKFFGDGALNLDLISKRRSELWILLKDDIGIVQKSSGQRHVMTRNDVGIIKVNPQQKGTEPQSGTKLKPRILQIVDEQGTTGLAGFYIRLPETAFNAYGDLLPQCEHRGIVWAGNKILYVISDAVSSAFQYEIRLDEIVTTDLNGSLRTEGAMQIEQPLQEMYESVYFSIPNCLKRFLVPTDDEEIRIELHCDLIDMRTSKHWVAKDTPSISGIAN